MFVIPDPELARRAQDEVPNLVLAKEGTPGSVRVTCLAAPDDGRRAATARTLDDFRVTGLEFPSPEAALSWLWRVTMNRS